MPHQYRAADTRNGLEVLVTGEFPEDTEDRIRIARTSNLFTRLMATILTTDNATERRERFRAVETQLEVAEALIRGDMHEVQRLIRDTLTAMGVSDEQLREVEEELRKRLADMGGDPNVFGQLFEEPDAAQDAPYPDPRYPDDPPPDDRPLDDRPADERPADDRPLDDRPLDDR